MGKRYLSAQEVADELNISLQTVYAYVSRGLLRSEPDDGHMRRYLREDVERLKSRKEARRNPSKVAEQALHWGTPVLESAITLISDGQLYYRGLAATELAQTSSVEAVAALIWVDDIDQATSLFSEAAPPIPTLALPTAPIEAFAAVLPVVAASDFAAYDLRPSTLPRTGARILQLLTAVATGAEAGSASIAQRLSRAWAADQPHSEAIIRAALILCADHELNVSSFTARCVASAESTLYAVVSAGLAALQGIKHGKQSELAELLLDELAEVDDVRQALGQRLRLGQPIPGFGHTLYPQGDPRAQMLIELVRQAAPTSPTTQLMERVQHEALSLLNEHPTLDFGLAAVVKALGLPAGSALTLFALGRTIGWIGHAIEQYTTNQLIRPRARYIGPAPR